MLNPRRCGGRGVCTGRGCRPLSSSVGVVLLWRRPLALSLASSVGIGVVRGRWRRLLASSLALASSVGIVIGVGVVHGRWRRPWALASSVGVVIGVGVVRWRCRCPLARERL